MAAPPLLLLSLAYTLVLSLLPLLVLSLPRLVRSSKPIQGSLIGASTLCVGLYGICAIVALAGSGLDDGRVASLVAGTLGCVGVLLSASVLSSLGYTGSRDPARSTSGGGGAPAPLSDGG